MVIAVIAGISETIIWWRPPMPGTGTAPRHDRVMDKKRRKRSSSAAVKKRLDHYPFQEWLAECLADDPAGEDETWLEAEAGVDFHSGVAIFRTELHKLASRETSRRWAAQSGRGMGVVCRTTQRDVPDGNLAFRFDELPLEECPTFRRPSHLRGANRAATGAEQARALEDGFCRLTLPVHAVGKPPSFNADCPCTAGAGGAGLLTREEGWASEAYESMLAQALRTGTGTIPLGGGELTVDFTGPAGEADPADAATGWRPGDEVTFHHVRDEAGNGFLVLPGQDDGRAQEPSPAPAPDPAADFQEWLRQQALQRGGGEGG
jgi:hypothetical protein